MGRLFTFIKVVVHVIITDQWIQVTVIYSRSSLVAVTSECCVKRVICKTWTDFSTGTLENKTDQDQTPRITASDQGLHCLLKSQEVKS